TQRRMRHPRTGEAPEWPLGSLRFEWLVVAFAALLSLAPLTFAQAAESGRMVAPSATAASQKGRPSQPSFSPAQVASGHSLFLQNCAFCHGRDAGGGESGPDLTRSKLVGEDVNGNRIGLVVRNGRPGKGMPAFNMSDTQIADLAAFIHAQRAKAETQKGGRRGVDVADLQTGNAEAGKQFFYGAGGCSRCHSPTGDLAGIALRYQGLQLEEELIYPRHAQSKVTVTLPSGEVMTGTLAYRDEFILGLRDAAGYYHSWPVSDIKYSIDSPVQAHVALLAKYTDADIHNLMAYLQTLR
ncbi:MAG TPA: c-type cytochrome, partial [Terriglobia bacterium]|nr:c-type cytochrome [Terriglobia bacterium]